MEAAKEQWALRFIWLFERHVGVGGSRWLVGAQGFVHLAFCGAYQNLVLQTTGCKPILGKSIADAATMCFRIGFKTYFPHLPGDVMVSRFLRKPAVKHGEVAHCERSENRGSGGGGCKKDHFEALPHLIGVATVVDFGSILRLMYQVAIG